jgi:DNA polymerase
MGLDSEDALALLAWQVELGATEAILDAPVDRFVAPTPAPRAASPSPQVKPAGAPAPPPVETIDPVAFARAAAKDATTLEELETALGAFGHCELQKGARTTVFADGRPGARVMIIGEAPGRDEDRLGKPFVGRAGQLLNAMLAAIGLAREGTDAGSAVYITNVLPWRPPQNRDPRPDEIAMMLPFVEAHVALAAPDVVVPMGNISCQALLGRRGITQLRGNWTEAFGRPALPMFHPAYLLRNPHAKREAWTDLLLLQDRLRTQS